MSLLVAGTICFDTIETPHGQAERILGGSGAYAAVAASLLAPVRLVGVVGDDFTPSARELLRNRGVDLAGVQTLAGVRTQFWHGRYHRGMRMRDHVDVVLDILDHWKPVIPGPFRESTHVLLAHMPPQLQLVILDQLTPPAFVLADTIDHWINTRRSEVEHVFSRVTAVVVNDQEAQLLTGEPDPKRAARAIQALGPRFVIVKRGEEGSCLYQDGESFDVHAFPADPVIDPTGAGDTYAGALLGRLHGITHPALADLHQAAIVGSVVASFTVEGFGLDGLQRATVAEMNRRLMQYRERWNPRTPEMG